VRHFGTSIHHPSSSSVGSFFLLVVFHRSLFLLTKELLGLALHSVLGGSPGGFHLGCIKPCHFRLSVASKEVGFMITTLRRITTAFFDVYFHLWRDGSPNWRKELCKWEEEDSSWMLVTRKRKSKSTTLLVLFVKNLPPPKLPMRWILMLLSLVVFIALLIYIRLLMPSSSPACFMTALAPQSLRFLVLSRTSFQRRKKKTPSFFKF
jgi:hypothetical protein